MEIKKLIKYWFCGFFIFVFSGFIILFNQNYLPSNIIINLIIVFMIEPVIVFFIVLRIVRFYKKGIVGLIDFPSQEKNEVNKWRKKKEKKWKTTPNIKVGGLTNI